MAILIDQRKVFVATDLPPLIEIRDGLFPSLSNNTSSAVGFNIKVDGADVRVVISLTGVSGMNQKNSGDEDSGDTFCIEGDLVRASKIRIEDDPANEDIRVVVRCDSDNNGSSATFSIMETCL